MSNTLSKPFTKDEKSIFICDNNALRIEETETALFALEKNEIMVDGEPAVNPDYEAEQLQKAKELKLNEAVYKCSEKRYNQTFTVEIQEQECEFDTTEQTQSDLQTAAIVTANGGTYDNWVTNNGVVLNLTAEDIQTVFGQFFALVSPLYTKQLEYVEHINACETIEELENTVINYGEEETDTEQVNEETS